MRRGGGGGNVKFQLRWGEEEEMLNFSWGGDHVKFQLRRGGGEDVKFQLKRGEEEMLTFSWWEK